MLELRLSEAAGNDIRAILAASKRDFGHQAFLRYDALLNAALDAIRIDPRRAGVKERPEIGPGRVKLPRHPLVFSIVEPGLVIVGRVIHDAMELARHVPLELSPDFDI